MSRELIALALTALLGGGCFGQTPLPKHPSPQQQATAIAANSAVEVKFLDGSHRRGWISDVSDTGFALSDEKKGQIEKVPVAFAQVKAVKQVASVKPSHTGRHILIGVGIAVGALMVFAGILDAAGCC